MTDTSNQAATQTATVTATDSGTQMAPLAPPPTGDVVPYEQADAPDKAQIETLIAEIDLTESQSVISFGAKAQTDLQAVTGQMLDGVRNKEAGEAGKILNEVVLSVRGFDLSGLSEKPGLLARLFGAVKPLARVLQRYETVQRQIHGLRTSLEQHKEDLLRDIIMLDRLYDSSLTYFHDLELYIAAGMEKLRRVDETEVPEARQAAEGDDPLKSQALQRLIAAKNDLERKVHDLKLTRQVTMQSLPSIALVQDNDKSLVTKIDSTVVNTIPLWEVQIAQAVTLHRSQQAAGTIRKANDLTNELLEANAANLKQANAEVRREIERGVFDIESIKKANADLIATIEESVQIAEEGRQQRQTAERELVTAEEQLRTALEKAR